MLKHQWIDTFSKQEITGIYKQRTVTSSNASYILLQVGRSVQISKINASLIKRDYLMEWSLPDSMKSTPKDNYPTYLEADLFEKMMTALIKFLEKNERELRGTKSVTLYEALAKIMTELIVIVENKEAKLYVSRHLLTTFKPSYEEKEMSKLYKEMVSYLEKSIKQEPYTLRTVSLKSELTRKGE